MTYGERGDGEEVAEHFCCVLGGNCLVGCGIRR